ncbi:MAG TPA: hypothetical protein VK982_02750, partial [Bacteroidales bacterium]|nr:hypothetical protein [Bacteroidales bacterium]
SELAYYCADNQAFVHRVAEGGSNSIGLGGGYAIKPGIKLNLGVGYTIYNDARKIYDAQMPLGGTIATTEEYDKDNLFVALGLDFKFGKN